MDNHRKSTVMIEHSDMDLLREYARNHSEQAFRTVVERHINVVCAVALRQTGDWQQAQDVTQTVFIDLAEKSASLPRGTLLAGWLFRATRYAAANALRARARREHWEHKAAQMEPAADVLTPPGPEVEEPLLLEALEELPENDRTAILLRFFERKSLNEVGRTLGTTEAAAKMRLARATEKLRRLFRKRGVVVPASAIFSLLSVQAAQGAPAGLAATVTTAALLTKTSSVSTLLIAKGTVKALLQAKSQQLLATACAFLVGGSAALFVQQSIGTSVAQETAAPPAKAPAAAAAKEAKPATTVNTNKALLFRDRPSWGRNPDFEDRLDELGIEFDVLESSEMATANLSDYRFVIIPGAQWRSGFYATFTAQSPRFENYVTNGGVIALEMNGAEDGGLLLPAGVRMVKNGAVENTIVYADHPALVPFRGQPIRANFASHGYLENLPTNALVLAAETVDGKADLTRPTYAEYSFGRGRIIAACQCFHDQDRSGRGPLMPALLSYALERRWYAPQKR